MIDNENLKVGEDIIVVNKKSSRYNQLGEVDYIVRTPDGEIRVGVMFGYERCSFGISEIERA
ncbi:hypothetical protein [Azohydromonas lata]|uniref:Uncharacterized protein n=1 Tax=Azohydromonas lata TaxID=45677 RepID=A0ABU5IK77_9BURK|nr:hypothetical protein [Azohydromonas lata]MDZ5459274.1 hypothetical protein [Azohydromonas lata]